MLDQTASLKDGLGRKRGEDDELSIGSVRRLAAMLDQDPKPYHRGVELPESWYAVLFGPTAVQSNIGRDGHPLTKGHAGCGCFAALLAFAGDGDGLSGSEALGHLILGDDVAIRAGIAVHATASDYLTTGAWVSLAAAALRRHASASTAASTRPIPVCFLAADGYAAAHATYSR